VASELYNRYHEEYEVRRQARSRFDGIMINDTTRRSMQARSRSAQSCQDHQRVQILMLGAPLPIVENPLRLAEEWR